jgi:hypothetical protein
VFLASAGQSDVVQAQFEHVVEIARVGVQVTGIGGHLAETQEFPFVRFRKVTVG